MVPFYLGDREIRALPIHHRAYLLRQPHKDAWPGRDLLMMKAALAAKQ